MKTPLKWIGGKRWFAQALAKTWWAAGRNRLVVPFAGGLGATLHLEPRQALIGDVCWPIVNFWKRVQVGLLPDPDVDLGTDKETYLRNRALFNGLWKDGRWLWHTKDRADGDYDATLFWYLNRVGFNGLWRLGPNGFNVPHGGEERKCDPDSVRWHELAVTTAPWDIQCRNWDATLRKADPTDFVFVDPPYDGGFVGYTREGFDFEQQQHLCTALAAHPGPVVATNHATDRIIALYTAAGFTVQVTEAPRRIRPSADRTALEAVLTRNCTLNLADLKTRSRKSTMPKPLFVSRAFGNVKGGVDVTLGRFTLIIGDSGSGKSAIPNVVELALTGVAADITGRDLVSKPQDLIALAPGRAEKLEATVMISDGTQAEYGFDIPAPGKTKGRYHRCGHDPDKVLPLRAVQKELTGSADRARRFLVQQTQDTVTETDILSRIPESQRERYRAVRGAATADAGADLLRVHTAAKQRGKAAADSAKAAKAVIAATVDGGSAAPTEEILRAAVQRDQTARVAVESAAAALGQDRDATPEHIAQELGKCATEITACDKILAVELGLQVTQERAQERALNGTALMVAIKLHVDKDKPDCAICGTVGAGVAIKARAAEMNAAIQEAVLGDRAALEAWAQRERTTATRVQWVAYRARLVNAQTALPALTVARTEAGKAAAALTKLREDKARSDALTRARGSQTTDEQEALAWAQLVESCDVAVKGLLIAAIEEFTSKVQGYLPATDRFALRLREGDREVCQYGLLRCPNCHGRKKVGGTSIAAVSIRDKETGKMVKTKMPEPADCPVCDAKGTGTDADVLHTALSGGEWARVTAALAIVCGGDAPLQVVIPEDRGMDGATLGRVMRAFSTALAKHPRVQIVLTSCVKYAGTKPKGWEVRKIEGLPGAQTMMAVDAEETEETEIKTGATGNGAGLIGTGLIGESPGESEVPSDPKTLTVSLDASDPALPPEPGVPATDVGTVKAWMLLPEPEGGGYIPETEEKMSDKARAAIYAAKVPSSQATILADGSFLKIPPAEQIASLLS